MPKNITKEIPTERIPIIPTLLQLNPQKFVKHENTSTLNTHFQHFTVSFVTTIDIIILMYEISIPKLFQ